MSQRPRCPLAINFSTAIRAELCDRRTIRSGWRGGAGDGSAPINAVMIVDYPSILSTVKAQKMVIASGAYQQMESLPLALSCAVFAVIASATPLIFPSAAPWKQRLAEINAVIKGVGYHRPIVWLFGRPDCASGFDSTASANRCTNGLWFHLWPLAPLL